MMEQRRKEGREKKEIMKIGSGKEGRKVKKDGAKPVMVSDTPLHILGTWEPWEGAEGRGRGKGG